MVAQIVEGTVSARNYDKDAKLTLWEAAKERYGKVICPACGNEILDINDADVDHITAYKNGGETTMANAQLLHLHCNRHKGAN